MSGCKHDLQEKEGAGDEEEVEVAREEKLDKTMIEEKEKGKDEKKVRMLQICRRTLRTIFDLHTVDSNLEKCRHD